MELKYIERTSGIDTKEKIAYSLGDVASLMLFAFVTSLLQKYYTDVLGIPIIPVLILFVIARLWDAINDPMWGRIVDKRKAHPLGRYRPWMLWLSIPLALCAVAMFVKIPGLNTDQYFVYACVTYILFGMLYTGINIPYGSLASVITTDEKERNSLSVFRSVGSVLGNIPSLILMAVVPICSDNASKITIGVGITAFLSVIIYYLCYRYTTERVPTPPASIRSSKETRTVIKNLCNSRPFISLCIAGMLLLATQMFVQSFYIYLFNSYFKAQWLNTINQVATYLPVAILMCFMGKINRIIGKKEICAIGMAFSAVMNFILFILQTTNPIVFLVLSFLSGFGNTFFFLQVWSLVTDAIDYNEVHTDMREDATSYAFFTFTRKLGQTIASILSLLSLQALGYSKQWSDMPDLVPASATAVMYDYAVLIPAVLYLIMALVLWLWYPLGKKELQQLQIAKNNSLQSLLEKE